MITPVNAVESLLGGKIVIPGKRPIGPRSHRNERGGVVVEFARRSGLRNESQEGLRNFADTTTGNLVTWERLAGRRTLRFHSAQRRHRNCA